MKLNSNTILLENDELSPLLEITENIAKNNDIFNIGEANIILEPDQGNINFKTITLEE